MKFKFTKLRCPCCGKTFDPADRASPTAREGSVVQIQYCSEKCKKKAANQRYYEKHRQAVQKKQREAWRRRHQKKQ